MLTILTPTRTTHTTLKSILIVSLLSFLTLFIMPTQSNAHSTGFSFQKQVNGSYKSSLIANFRPFHSPTIFINTSAVFSSPRSSLLSFNHEFFELSIGSSFTIFGGLLDLSTGFQRYWGGNSQSLPDGYIDSTNTASLIWSW